MRRITADPGFGMTRDPRGNSSPTLHLLRLSYCFIGLSHLQEGFMNSEGEILRELRPERPTCLHLAVRGDADRRIAVV